MTVASWAMDDTHSSIGFSARHMMIANVRGQFEKFEATVSADPTDFKTAQVTIKLDPKSINTRNEQRDEHLRSADFFHVEEHPQLIFESSKLTHIKDEEYLLEGQMTIAGISKPISLNCEITGPHKDPWGLDRIGVEASGSINRTDFGIVWNTALETGGVLVSETIKLSVEMEFTKVV